MKRRLYPTGKLNRVAFWASLFNIGNVGIQCFYGSPNAWDWSVFIASAIFLVGMYLFQDDDEPEANEYNEVIANIATMGSQLSKLSRFLEGQKGKVADAQRTLEQLRTERGSIEPVLTIEREKVEALLAVYTKRTVRSSWKERAMGFVLGLTASLIASILYARFSK